MEGVASGRALALNDTASGRMAGIGLTMEAIEQNPAIYELMMEHAWKSTPVSLEEWLPRYVRNRYDVSTCSGPGISSSAYPGRQMILYRTFLRIQLTNARYMITPTK